MTYRTHDPETGKPLPSYGGSAFPANWDLIPVHMIGPLRRYIEIGGDPGRFLTCLLSNDLFGAAREGDEDSQRNMKNYVSFLVHYAPHACYGSKEAFGIWRKYGGLSGLATLDKKQETAS